MKHEDVYFAVFVDAVRESLRKGLMTETDERREFWLREARTLAEEAEQMALAMHASALAVVEAVDVPAGAAFPRGDERLGPPGTPRDKWGSPDWDGTLWHLFGRHMWSVARCGRMALTPRFQTREAGSTIEEEIGLCRVCLQASEGLPSGEGPPADCSTCGSPHGGCACY